MGYMGYRKRTGFLAGLTVAQISEFSIVFVAMGISLGHVGIDALGLTTLVGLVTIAFSTYMILYSHPLYERLSPWLGFFERRHPHREQRTSRDGTAGRPEVIVFGLGRYGSRLAGGLKDAGLEVLGVDFDPEVSRAQRRKGLQVRFGDGTEADFIESLPLSGTAWVVSTLPDLTSNQALLHALREHHYGGEIAVVARGESEGVAFKKLSVSTVLYRTNNAVDYVVNTLTKLIHRKERAR